MDYFLRSSKVSNSQSKEFVLITEIFWWIFWRDNWRSLIGVVENFCYYFTRYFLTVLWMFYNTIRSLINKNVCVLVFEQFFNLLAVVQVTDEKKSTQLVVFYVTNEKFCQPCLFIQAYSFIRDLRVCMCHWKLQKYLVKPKWVINGWWHRFGFRLFWFSP